MPKVEDIIAISPPLRGLERATMLGLVVYLPHGYISIATGLFRYHSSAMNLKVKFVIENRVIAFKANLYSFNNAVSGW